MDSWASRRRAKIVASRGRHAGLARNELLRRNALPVGLVALASLAIGTLYVRHIAPAGCMNDQALDRVTDILRTEFHFDGVFLNNFETVSGWYLSARHDCSAEAVQIRGNVDAGGMPWREIHYRIVQRDGPESLAVTVEMGKAVPLAAQTPPFWKRLLAYL
jgi:hypothetical protein